MTDLPRKAVARTARLAALPLGYAGRTALGVGKRLGGKPAEAVLTEVQQRTAEQLFRTLGELKGGAMKFGQALSRASRPPCPRDRRRPTASTSPRSRTPRPPMPTQTVREVLADAARPRLARASSSGSTARPPPPPRIGQVHRARVEGRARRGRQGPVPRRRRGADGRPPPARPAGPGHRPGVPRASTSGRWSPSCRTARPRSSTTASRRRRSRRSPTAFADDPDIRRPGRRARAPTTVLVTEWMESTGSLAKVIADGTQDERDHYGELLRPLHLRRPGPDRDAARRPAPRQLPHHPAADGSPGRLGVLDFGAVSRLPGGTFPPAMGHLLRTAMLGDSDALLAGLREEGFVRDGIRVDATGAARLPAGRSSSRLGQERFRFTRAWMRGQFERLNDPEPRLHAGRQAQPAAVVPPHPPHLARRRGAAEPARGGGAVPRRSSRRACPASSTTEPGRRSADPEAAAPVTAEVVPVRRAGLREPR